MVAAEGEKAYPAWQPHLAPNPALQHLPQQAISAYGAIGWDNTYPPTHTHTRPWPLTLFQASPCHSGWRKPVLTGVAQWQVGDRKDHTKGHFLPLQTSPVPLSGKVKLPDSFVKFQAFRLANSLPCG